ncbi:MAG: hypothetical protein EOM36_01360 [Bacteroidia bacterium]|jgi:hypothetical protein|nr:hypothetical protein [Bacteroidia bacterium]
MEFYLDVDQLRSQFPVPQNLTAEDTALVFRLFEYLDKINNSRNVKLSLHAILNRHELRSTLGVSTQSRLWPPLFASIVEAADKQLQNQKYQSRSIHPATKAVCKRLRHWVREQVRAGTLPLNRWGYLSIVAMSKAIGCSDSSSSWKPLFCRHIERINRILEKQPSHPKNSPYHCYIEKHNKYWNFDIAQTLDADIGAKIVECWRKDNETLALATASTGHNALRIFIQFWVNRASSGDPRFVMISRKLADGDRLDHSDMDVILFEFREYVLGELSQTKGSVKVIFSRINSLFKTLHREGVLPQSLELKLPGRAARKALASNRSKKSLAEVPSSRRSESEIRHLLQPLIEKRFSHDEVVEVTRADFLATLISEGVNLTASRNTHVKQIGELNSSRLVDLRRCAEDELLACWNVYTRGQKLLQNCDLSYKKDIEPLVNEWLEMAVKTQGSPMGRTKLSTIFNNRDIDQEVLLSRYLCLCENRWDGFIPSALGWELKHFHHHTFMKIGGRDLAVSMMQPTIEAYIAVMIILLVDTGANVDVINTLKYPCLDDRDEPNQKIIGGWKPRAGNDFIQNIIQVDDGNRISGVRAIEMIVEMTSRLRRMATDGPKSAYRHVAYSTEVQPGMGLPQEHLFLTRLLPTQPMRILSKGTRAINFQRFLARHSELNHIKIKMDHIRSSVLLDASIKNEGRLLVGQIIADHKSRDVQGGYVNKYVQHVIQERSIRKFQELLEAVLIFDIFNGYKILGIPEDDYREALNEAHRTGLGVMCLKPLAGAQSGTIEGTMCDKLERCPACKNMFIPAIQENIQDMILFNQYLKEKREEFEALSLTDWEEIWLPYMVLTDEALSRIEKGDTAAVYLAAKEAVDGLSFSSLPLAI